jgi:hypothetical protein
MTAAAAAAMKPAKPTAEDWFLVQAYDQCLVAAARQVPEDREGRSQLVARAQADCRTSLRTRMDANEFVDVGKAGSAKRARSEAVLDYVDGRFSDMILAMPLASEVNARIAAMNIEVRVPEPVAAQHSRYGNCVTSAYQADRPRSNVEAARVKAWRQAIRACRSTKAAMMAQADSILAGRPDYQDPARRRAALSEMFDGYDRAMLKMAEVDWTKR